MTMISWQTTKPFAQLTSFFGRRENTQTTRKYEMGFLDFLGMIADLFMLMFDRQFRRAILIVLSIIIFCFGFASLIYYIITHAFG